MLYVQMKSFTHRVVPKTGMEELILGNVMRERIESIISFEKARAVLLGQWGFEQERLGTACMFWGPHGTGKSSAAEVQCPRPGLSELESDMFDPCPSLVN